MFRILILFSAFLIAVAGMLFMQGGQRDPGELAYFSTEDEVELDGVSQLSARVAAPAPAPVEETSLTDLTAAVRASVTPNPVATPAAAQDDGLAAMTSGVLANLGTQSAPAPTPAPSSEMEQATAAVLASLTGATTPRAQTGQPRDLRTLITQSMNAGQSDAYIDALVNEAVVAGTVDVPPSLITADGRVDTRTLLASIVQQSMGPADDASIRAIAAEARAGERPSVQVTETASGDRFYTVEPGDSLAYIAMVFYGDSALFGRVFDANRDVIERPDMIRVGQKLRIPG